MTRVTAVERVHRILTILPWIMANPGCRISEVAQRFAIDEKSLREDLDVVFNRVEVYPFTPDMLIDVVIDEDQIFISLGDYFSRPPGLNEREALMLLTAGELSIRFAEQSGSITDGGLLASAVDKLAASIGQRRGAGDGPVAIRIADTDPTITEVIREAIDANLRMHIEYYSYGRDELNDRTIDPWRLSNRNGFWYLRAFCHRAGAEREFRLDRIYSAQTTDEHFEPVTGMADEGSDRSYSGRIVTLRGPSSIDWVARTYPVEATRTDDHQVMEIDLVVAHDQWLERLLLRLPPEATAVDTSSGESLARVRSNAARRILDRYGIT